MNEYTIYCTAEQTKKALELGAQIEESMSRNSARSALQDIENGKETFEEYANQGIALVNSTHEKKALKIPTAEQMIGWLEEQGEITDIEIYKFSNNGDWRYIIFLHTGYSIDGENCPTRKEATIAAIDAALEFLTDKKKWS